MLQSMKERSPQSYPYQFELPSSEVNCAALIAHLINDGSLGVINFETEDVSPQQNNTHVIIRYGADNKQTADLFRVSTMLLATYQKEEIKKVPSSTFEQDMHIEAFSILSFLYKKQHQKKPHISK